MNERHVFIEQQLRDYKANKGMLVSSEELHVMPVEAPERLSDIRWHVQAIDDYLAIASDEDKLLVESRYFQPRPLTAWQVANALFISRTEFYIRRDKILNWLDKRMGYLVSGDSKDGAA